MMRKSILAASCAAIVMFACSGDRVGPNTGVAGFEDEPKTTAVQKEKIYGVAQKGPFVNGDVVIYELDDKYEKTKRTFKGKTDSKGYFEIEIKDGKLASPYVIIEAKGKYANEVSGKTSSNAITLKAVADISNKDNVNINVLTDLESDKVIKLAKEGKSFDEAKTQAQKEVFTSLGISEGSVTRNSEDMALFGGNSSDSVLLVVSVSLQGDKTEAELSALLADLSGSGKFDVEKGLKDVDMGKVKDHILEIEPSAVVSIPTTPKAPTTTPNTSTNSGSSSKGSGSGSGSGSTTPSTSTKQSSSSVTSNTPVVVLPKCGNWDYNPATQVCKNGEVKDPICGEVKYNPATHFCTRSESNPQVVEKCGGKGYDTGTKICVDGKIEETNLFRDARDGKKYKYVKIGEQVWMAENLNYAAEGSKCNVGSVKIQATSVTFAGGKLSDTNIANCDTYGRLYKWETAMGALASSEANPSNVQGVCPAGWHLPSNAEWTQLIDFVGGATTAGVKLKATSGWPDYSGTTVYNGINTNGTDDYGFSALPGGNGSNKWNEGSGMGREGWWWSATQDNADTAKAYVRIIDSNKDSVYNWTVYKDAYFGTILYPNDWALDYLVSVRCVKGQGVAPKICDNKYYNPATHFCSGKEIYSLYQGKEYEPATCGTEKYNSATHFCTKSENNPAVVEKCGGKGYDNRTKVCVNGNVQDKPTFTDARDGKEYKYVKIGTQTWMAENLKYKTDKYNWTTAMDLPVSDCGGKVCNAADKILPQPHQGICPEGWHVPMMAEWFTLISFVGAGMPGFLVDGVDVAGTIAGTKLRATSSNGTDNYGFAAATSENWWTGKDASSGSYCTEINANGRFASSICGKSSLKSLRCVQNEPGTVASQKCGDNGYYYNPLTHFCKNLNVVPLCGGKEFDAKTEHCVNGNVQRLPIVLKTFTDKRDTTEYKFVKIGEQEWMAENLNYNAKDSKCYNNQEEMCDTYGRLYTWATAKDACPVGWHLPSDDEWVTLGNTVAGTNLNYSDEFLNTKAGTKLKAISGLWELTEKAKAGTDDYGFAALPGGSYDGSKFSSIRWNGYWWSTTTSSNQAYNWSLSNSGEGFSRAARVVVNANPLVSVRCLKGFPKCGDAEYEHTTQFCSDNKVYSLCGGNKYEPTTHFCTKSESKPKIVPLCGGKGYDTRTKYCSNGTTKDYGSISYQGKTYKTVEIGTQTWMAENLNYAAEGSKCGNGTTLSDANTATCDTYGRLYTWATANEVCPSGWHLPSNDEWTTLTDYVGKNPGTKLKAYSSLWTITGTDDYGFTALPGGFYNGSTYTTTYGYWWAATENPSNAANAYSRYVQNTSTSSYASEVFSSSAAKTRLHSVRCVQGIVQD